MLVLFLVVILISPLSVRGVLMFLLVVFLFLTRLCLHTSTMFFLSCVRSLGIVPRGGDLTIGFSPLFLGLTESLSSELLSRNAGVCVSDDLNNVDLRSDHSPVLLSVGAVSRGGRGRGGGGSWVGC